MIYYHLANTDAQERLYLRECHYPSQGVPAPLRGPLDVRAGPPGLQHLWQEEVSISDGNSCLTQQRVAN